MSLFYSTGEKRITIPKKRKRSVSDTEVAEDVHNEKHTCGWCHEDYDSETELHVHKRVKHREDVITLLLNASVCKTCLTPHENREELVKHVKTSHLLSSDDAEHVHREIFICDICHQVYFNKQMLSIHMQYIHDKAHKHKLSGTCPKCNKNIRIRHAWFHFQRHSIQSVSCCPICMTKCKTREDLIEHVKTHTKFFRCTICGYDTRFKESFATHMQTHNSNLHLSRNIAIDEALLWKCFMPRKMSQVARKNDFNLGIRGLRLFDLFICVLCRGICTEEERVGHITKYHLVDIVAVKRQYLCVCGEQFFNNVLLKHHVFKQKGQHRAVICDTVPVTYS